MFEYFYSPWKLGHVGKQAAYLITFTGVAGRVKVNMASERTEPTALISNFAKCKQQGNGAGKYCGDEGGHFCTPVHSQKRENHVY